MIGEYYKVTNLSPEPCTMTWNVALLESEDLARYEDYKETPDFKGINEQDMASKRKVAPAVRARPFFAGLGKDVQVKVYDKEIQGDQAVASPRYEWRFCIGPNTEKLIKDGDLLKARQICEKWEVSWSRDDTIKALAGKLKDKFGDNVRLLTQKQWLESGLQSREKKEIKLKLRPGETKARVITEGYLEAYPMTAAEAEAFLQDEKESVKKETEELEKKQAERDEKKNEIDVDVMNRQEIKGKLDELGVDYKGNASNDDLRALLKDTLEK